MPISKVKVKRHPQGGTKSLVNIYMNCTPYKLRISLSGNTTRNTQVLQQAGFHEFSTV